MTTPVPIRRWYPSRRSNLITAALGLVTSVLALSIPSEPLVHYGFAVVGLVQIVLGLVTAVRWPRDDSESR